MQRILLACVFAAFTTCGHAADLVVYYGPGGEILANGKYTRVTVSWVSGQAVLSQQVVLDVGGVVPPPPPPPPPPDTVTTKIQAFIAAVTADPTKADTSKGLALAYGQVLSLTEDAKSRDVALLNQLSSEAVMALAEASVIKDAAMLRKVAETIVDQVLASPQVMKTATWKPFTDGMKALAAPMDFAGVVNAYTIAQAQLGGGPNPPPPPPPPPPPLTTAVKAAVLIETEGQTAEQATLLSQWRNDKSWSPLLVVIDPDLKTEAGQPDPLAQAAVKACGSHPLPRLLLRDSAGSFVGECLALPMTWDATKSLLTQQGVKP